MAQWKSQSDAIDAFSAMQGLVTLERKELEKIQKIRNKAEIGFENYFENSSFLSHLDENTKNEDAIKGFVDYIEKNKELQQEIAKLFSIIKIETDNFSKDPRFNELGKNQYAQKYCKEKYGKEFKL